MIKKTITTFLVVSTVWAFTLSKSVAVDLVDGMSFALGVTGSAGAFSGSGEETEGTSGEVNKSEGSELMAIAIPSIFGEVTIADRLTVGFDYTSLSEDTEVQSRTDNAANEAEGISSTGNTGTSTIQASFENIVTAYAELNLIGGMFVTMGHMQMDINTKENLHTESSYGNITIDGTMYGVGHKSNFDGWYLKTSAVVTDWDDFTILAASSSSGTANGNKVDGKINGVMAKVSIAKTF
jgi:hypothetical protein